MTKKLKPLLSTSKLPASGVITKAGGIVGQIGFHVATFATPNPPLSAITDQSGKLQIKIDKQNAAWSAYKEATEEVQVEREILEELLEQERFYVEGIANGDKVKILAAGFDMRKDPVATGILPAPLNVITKEGSSDGELIVTWKSVKGAKAYNVEISYDNTDAANWAFYITVTKCKCYITGIESGTRVYTRVVAINSNGQGGYSDISTKTVP